MRTTGDKRHDVSLATIGGKGLFIKELEEALERNEVDIAVHSLKDVPSIIPDHFVLAGFLERADPRDAWIHVENKPIAEMPEGSVIGTSAPRRRAQLVSLFPKLKIEDMQGGSFTETNPRNFGGLYATPIIKQPEVAILAIGGIQKRAAAINDAIAIRSMAYIDLSFDHRVIDGVDAERFMARLKEILQTWSIPIK